VPGQRPPPSRNPTVATVDPNALPEVAGRAGLGDGWLAADAGWVACSKRRRPGGWRSASALYRAAIPVGGRIAVAGGSGRPVVRGRETTAEVHRVGHPAGRAQDQGPAPPIRCPAVSRARRLSVPPQPGLVRDLRRRNRQAAVRAQEAWRARPVRTWVPAARIRLPPDPSNRALSAKRRRGRSLQISFGVRRRGRRPLSSINYTRSRRSHTATQVRRSCPANVKAGQCRTLMACG
jgi:hypothetical protein